MPRPLPNLKRRAPVRDPRKRVVLFCEGRNTEPEYFRALEKLGCLAYLDIRGGCGSPDAIATQAIGEKRKKTPGKAWYEADDEIWAVFDRDEHEHYEQAIAQCSASGVNIARSNPCFEVWIILHFQDYHRPDNRHDVQRILEELCPEYDRNRGKTADFSSIVLRVRDAEERAERQLKCRSDEGDEYNAPSTTVFHLTRSILGPPNMTSAT